MTTLAEMDEIELLVKNLSDVVESKFSDSSDRVKDDAINIFYANFAVEAINSGFITKEGLLEDLDGMIDHYLKEEKKKEKLKKKGLTLET